MGYCLFKAFKTTNNNRNNPINPTNPIDTTDQNDPIDTNDPNYPILSYFLLNEINSEKSKYSWIKTEYYIYIYYESKCLYYRLKYFKELVIYNYKNNIQKRTLNNRANVFLNNKYYINKYENDIIIYYKKDKIITKNNSNYIRITYKYTNSIKQKLNIQMQNADIKLDFLIHKKYYKQMIYRYKTSICKRKYNTIHIFIPNKYELYYYSNYFNYL
jgi:hypothetical protein